MHRRAPLAAVVDIAVVIVFVTIGRRNHDEGSALSGIASTAGPFLIALLVAWVVLGVSGKPVWKNPTAVVTGVMIWAITVVAGLLLRRFVFGDGTAVSFMIVATIFLGILVGWRVAANAIWNRNRDLTV